MKQTVRIMIESSVFTHPQSCIHIRSKNPSKTHLHCRICILQTVA